MRERLARSRYIQDRNMNTLHMPSPKPRFSVIFVDVLLTYTASLVFPSLSSILRVRQLQPEMLSAGRKALCAGTNWLWWRQYSLIRPVAGVVKIQVSIVGMKCFFPHSPQLHYYHREPSAKYYAIAHASVTGGYTNIEHWETCNLVASELYSQQIDLSLKVCGAWLLLCSSKVRTELAWTFPGPMPQKNSTGFLGLARENSTSVLVSSVAACTASGQAVSCV